MKITKKTLNKLILEELSFVLEGEEDTDIFGGGDEGGDEPAEDEGAEEATEEEGGEAADEEGGEEEGGEDEGAEEGGDEESDPAIPEPDLSALPPEERAELTKAVDDELNSLLMDFEANALHSIAAQEESMETMTQESYVGRLKRYLFEGEEEAPPKIDVHQFAADTARLVNNYQDLLDMEQLVFNKAKVFLMSKYDEASVEEFEEIMDVEHGISFGEKGHPEPFDDDGKPETPWPPRAVGAQPPAA